MKLSGKVGVLVSFISLGFAVGCGSDDVLETASQDEQRTEDIALIESYIAEKGFTDVDTTSSGVRYVIRETGSGEAIEYGDIVTLDFTGTLTNGEVFRSTVQAVVDTTDNLTAPNPRLVFTHSQSGWALDVAYRVELGFTEGVTKLLDSLQVGGSGILMIPSDLGFNDFRTAPVPLTSVLVYEISPVKVRK
ncbi:MAG: FKBP-type peptidyl-prolyl cis-trans isomerase [Cyclobacteriaceae bacterium]|nr:FKBP-type peptidyl-prolyl cis-trans isomerase [Cyclobacteriaceae bacterium HetDA_MAG_MS6]